MNNIFKLGLIVIGLFALNACSKQPIPDIIKDGKLKPSSNGNSMLYI